MNFREYKIGARMFGSGARRLHVHHAAAAELRYCQRSSATSISMDKQLTAGYETGFNVYDPLLLGQHKPVKVQLKTDPASGQAIEPVMPMCIEPGTPFPGGIRHPDNLGGVAKQLSLGVGKIGEARETDGAVFLVREDEQRHPYIEDATITRGWKPDAALKAAGDENAFTPAPARRCSCAKAAGGATRCCPNRRRTGRSSVRRRCSATSTASRRPRSAPTARRRTCCTSVRATHRASG